MRNLSLLFLLLIVSSCKSVVEVPITENLTLIIKELESSDTSFRALLAFKETTDYEEIIQEVKIKNAQGMDIQLVESFDTTWWGVPVDSRDEDGVQATVTDHHWSAVASGWEHRSCTFYAGRVLGADKDSVGFAMLPQNMDGSVKTLINPLVNQRYRKRQEIRGKIVARHPETARYQIDWVPGELTISSDLGKIVHRNGKNHYYPSDKWIGDRKQRNRWRSLRVGGRFS